MRWIVENHTREDSYIELVGAIKGSDDSLIELVGDYQSKILDPFRGDTETPVIFVGSIQMSKLVRAELPQHRPLVFCTFENYLCSKYYSHFGKYLFNDRYVMVPLSELRRRQFFFYGIFGREGIVFLRPDSGEKTFASGLLDVIDLDSFLNSNTDCEHELAVISTPKNIRWEGRFVVTDKKEIIAHSTYRYQGQITKIPVVPSGATRIVEELLDVGYYPDPIFVMDICEDSDGKFWLLELNAFTCSGLYACNKESVRVGASGVALRASP